MVWLQKVKYWPVSSTNRWTTGLTTEGQVVTSVQYKQLNQWSDYRRSSTDQCPVQTDKPVVWLQKVKYWPVSGIKWWTSGLTTEGQVLTSVWYKVMNQWSDYRRSSIDQCPVPRDMNRLVWLQKAKYWPVLQRLNSAWPWDWQSDQRYSQLFPCLVISGGGRLLVSWTLGHGSRPGHHLNIIFINRQLSNNTIARLGIQHVLM